MRTQLKLEVVALVCCFVQSLEAQVFFPKNEQTIYGRIVDEKNNPLIARVELWHQPLQERADSAIENLIRLSYGNTLGYYAIDVPVGTYLLRYSKGPEYEIKDEEVAVESTAYDGIEKNLVLKHLYDMAGKGWYGGDVHLHTVHSDGHNNPSELVLGLKGAGLTWGILTDHNSIAGGKEWLSTREQAFLPVLGNEVTTEYKIKPGKEGFGHQGQWFITSPYATDPTNKNIWIRAMFSDHRQVQETVDQTHQQGGLIAVNHPFTNWDWAGRFRSWGIVERIDAIEIWNGEPPLGPTKSFPDDVNRNNVALQIWFELLNAGNRLAAVGGSDTHDIYGLNSWPKGATYWKSLPGNSCTYVKMNSLTAENLKRSLSSGNSFVTSGFGPLLFVEINGTSPGGIVRTGINDSLRLTISILSNRKLLDHPEAIRIVVNGRELIKRGTHGETQLEDTLFLRVENDTWVAVIAFGDYPQLAISNPIFIDVPPFGDWENRQWKHPKEAKQWNEFQKFPAITISNGPQILKK